MLSESYTRFIYGMCFMLLSALALSISILLVKIETPYLTFYQLTFYRFFIPLILLLPCLFVRNARDKIAKSPNLKTHFLRAIFVVLAQYSLFYYLTQNNLLNASVLFNTAPLFIPLISFIFLKHRLHMWTSLSIVIAFIGVIFILKPDHELFTLMGFIGLFAGFSNGVSQVIFGYHAQEEKNIVSLFYLYLFATLLTLIPMAFLKAEGYELHLFSALQELDWDLRLFVPCIGLASLLTQFCRGIAYSKGKPSNLAAFLYFSVILAGMWDWFIFGISPDVFSIIGALLVICGGSLKAIMIYRYTKKH